MTDMKKMWLLVLLGFFTLAASGACPEGAEKGKVLVALGDSYISGEGIEPFYGQDAPVEEKCRNPDWLAHRSEKAWPGMLRLPGVEGVLADHRGENYFLAAASGARTRNLFLLTGEERKNGRTAEQEKNYKRGRISGTAKLAPQLDIFGELDEKGLKADYVVLTIGGNDVEFRWVIALSLTGLTREMPGKTNADKGRALLQALYEAGNVRKEIKRVFADVAARAGEQACILVAGYPYPLVDEAADSVFPRDSAVILNEAACFFCAELANLVDECRSEGMNICYVGVGSAFEGHGAYAEDPYINPVISLAGQQDLDDLAVVSSASMHPNLKGAEAYARCVQDAIDQLEAGSGEYIFDRYGREE